MIEKRATGKPIIGQWKEAKAGFSLIEVIVSLALLTGILLAIATAFVLGGRSVGEGREITDATLLASGILEEIGGWGFAEVYERLGATGSAAALSADSRTNAGASRWQPQIASRLNDGRAIIEVEPVGGGTLGAAKGLRITVRLEWTTGERPRRVALVRVRF